MNRVIFEQSKSAKEFKMMEQMKEAKAKYIDINKNFGRIPNYLLKMKMS